MYGRGRNQSLRVGTRNLRISCIVYRVSCIFDTRKYIHEILLVGTREYTIFKPLHEIHEKILDTRFLCSLYVLYS